MLTLREFEEASEIVKRVTNETKLIYSDYFSEKTGNKVYNIYSKIEQMSI